MRLTREHQNVTALITQEEVFMMRSRTRSISWTFHMSVFESFKFKSPFITEEIGVVKKKTPNMHNSTTIIIHNYP